MNKMKALTELLSKNNNFLQFSIIKATKTQTLINLPIVDPLLVMVLEGKKEIGFDPKTICSAGEFLFISNREKVNIRNIPIQSEYYAVFIEFSDEDFEGLENNPESEVSYFKGSIDPPIYEMLKQLIEYSAIAPPNMWHQRKRELIHFLYHSGYPEVSSMVKPEGLVTKVRKIVRNSISKDLSAKDIARLLFISESTLRRKLKAEQTSLTEIKSETKLGYGLYMVQSTTESIGNIAQACGYQSQSRFTANFKSLFGTTPTELRRNRSEGKSAVRDDRL